MDETDKLAKLEQFWKVATGGWDEWRKRANYAYEFYRGKQWESDVIEILKREKRPFLTLNKIKPILRSLSGWQRRNRQDLQVLARRGGLGSLAAVYTELLKYFYDESHADFENSLVFLDGIITGKGWIALDIDYTQDPYNGELLLKRERPTMIYEDPHAQRYDLSDARFIIRTYWADKEKIEMEFPKAKKDTGMLATVDSIERESIVGIETAGYQATGQITDLEKYRYLVKEYWWRKYKKQRLIVNVKTLEVKEEDIDDERAQALVNAAPDLRIVDRVMPVLNLTTVVGKIILQDKEDPFDGISVWPLIRFCDDWIDGYIKGEVDDLIDPQKEHNKRRSQALHILNTQAHSGIIQDEDALNPEEEAKVDKLGSTPGIRIKVKKGARFDIIQPAGVSTGHIALEKLAEDDMKKISGINADLLGYTPERQESGIAMRTRKEQGLLTAESIFDNFQFTQQILGETILEFIRKTDVLSEEEIRAIVQEKNLNVDLKELKSRKMGKYQAVLTTKKSTPTQRMDDFYAMLDAIKMGIPIPPEILIETSDLPAKEKILEAIQQAKAVQVPGGIPPQVPGGTPPV